MQNKKIGDRAEKKACLFLEKQGFKKITQNYHSCMGELDLVMQKEKTLLFVEVRFRKSNNYGSSIETITYPKQKRIIKTALFFLKNHPPFQRLHCRFDVIGIDANQKITWIKNAFTVQY